MQTIIPLICFRSRTNICIRNTHHVSTTRQEFHRVHRYFPTCFLTQIPLMLFKTQKPSLFLWEILSDGLFFLTQRLCYQDNTFFFFSISKDPHIVSSTKTLRAFFAFGRQNWPNYHSNLNSNCNLSAFLKQLLTDWSANGCTKPTLQHHSHSCQH